MKEMLIIMKIYLLKTENGKQETEIILIDDMEK